MRIGGADDSNNHWNPDSPLIWVCTYSADSKDSEKTSLSKNRKIKNKKGKIIMDIEDLIEGVDFRYVCVNEKYKKRINPDYIKMNVFYQLILASKEILGGLEHFIIDGKTDNKNLKRLREALSPPVPKIISRIDADKNYKLVNISHYIARILYHSYCDGKKGACQDYKDKRIPFRITLGADKIVSTTDKKAITWVPNTRIVRSDTSGYRDRRVAAIRNEGQHQRVTF
jgi:hypothetical protein